MGDWLYGDKTWVQTLAAVFDRMDELSKTKGAEYAGDIDRLANFRRNAAAIGLHPEQVWAVYAGKHWDAISTFVKDFATGTKREYSEPIEGRIDDLILYLILFRAMTAERAMPQTLKPLCNMCDALVIEQTCNGTRPGCPHPVDITRMQGRRHAT